MYTYAPGDKIKTKKGVGKFVGSIGSAAFVSVAGVVERVRLIDLKRTDDPLTTEKPQSLYPNLREWKAEERAAWEETKEKELVLSEKDSAIFQELIENPPEPNTKLKEAAKKHKERVVKLPARLSKKFLSETPLEELIALFDIHKSSLTTARKDRLQEAIKSRGGFVK